MNDVVFREKISSILEKAKQKGASQAEVSLKNGKGFSVQVRQQAVETIEHHEDQGLGITVYFGQKKASADTTDLSDASIDETLNAACHIAEFTLADPCAGLPEKNRLATTWPDLDLFHPYPDSIQSAIEMAMECERIGLGVSSQISNSEGASFSTYSGLNVYGNSLGFLASTSASHHSLSLSLIAELKGNKERDYSYSNACFLEGLWSAEAIAQDAANRTLQRLGPRKLPTQKLPVIFESRLASSLIAAYLNGISGGHLYRQTTCFIDSLGQYTFPKTISLFEDPFLPRALGSSPFDGEGVAIHPQYLVQNGLTQTYLLSTYSARQLGLKSTGHAGGVRTLFLQTDEAISFSGLLKKMDRGFLVTELIGQGLNLLTGDYSRGASGFWVEQGEIQYPVSEVTIAGNIKDMLKGIVGVGLDVDLRHKIKTGSLLIDEMMIGGA